MWVANESSLTPLILLSNRTSSELGWDFIFVINSIMGYILLSTYMYAWDTLPHSHIRGHPLLLIHWICPVVWMYCDSLHSPLWWTFVSSLLLLQILLYWMSFYLYLCIFAEVDLWNKFQAGGLVACSCIHSTELPVTLHNTCAVLMKVLISPSPGIRQPLALC